MGAKASLGWSEGNSVVETSLTEIKKHMGVLGFGLFCCCCLSCFSREKRPDYYSHAGETAGERPSSPRREILEKARGR